MRTNWDDADAREVALRYKDLWMVEHIFRGMKSLLQTRPIYHKCDQTIRGHVFCNFLALVLRKTLQDRLGESGITAEWADVMGDLDALTQMSLEVQGKGYLLRTPPKGIAAKVFTACRVALPPTLQPTSQ